MKKQVKKLEFDPPERATLSRQVADQIEETILANGLQPGVQLPAERALEEQMGVSRIVIREAMKSLAERGLIEIRSGLGTFVAQVDPTAVSKPLHLYIRQNSITPKPLFQVRRVIEAEIAELAAEQARPSDIQALQRNMAELGLAVEAVEQGKGDRWKEEFARLDLEFHHLLAEATQNPLFTLILQPLVDALLEVRRIGLSVPGAARKAFEDHDRILKAMGSREPKGARNAMLQHLNYIEDLVAEALRRKPG